MKSLLISLVLFIYFTSFAQEFAELKIIVITREVQEEDTVFISGNNDQFGNWNPSVTNLEKIDDTLWTKTFSFPVDTHLEFKFTKGSWSNEALNENGTMQDNHVVRLLNDTTISFTINSWKDQNTDIITGQITGTVEYIRDVKTEGLEPRDIIIWLPPSYDSKSEKRYPALYMHDGQNIIDPATASFQVDWQIDETADSLIRAGEIEEIIIVGIYNTINRRSEYSPNDTGYRYMDFIVNELKPYIDRNYRTKPEGTFTAVGGSSMGGLISFMLAWEYPDVFSKAACLSPAFIYRNYDYVEEVRNYDGMKKPILLYIYNGGVDLEERLQPGIDEMMKVLDEKGYKINEDYYWFKDPEAVHFESAWAEKSWRFLKMFFGK